MYPLLEDDLPEYISALGPTDPRFGSPSYYLPSTSVATQPLAGPSAYSGHYATTAGPESMPANVGQTYYEQLQRPPDSGTAGALQLPPGTSPYYPPAHSLTPYTATFPLPSPGASVQARPDIGERRKTYPLVASGMQPLPGPYGLPYDNQAHSPNAGPADGSTKEEYFGPTGSSAPPLAAYAMPQAAAYGYPETRPSYNPSFHTYAPPNASHVQPGGVVLSRSASTDSERLQATAPLPTHEGLSAPMSWSGSGTSSAARGSSQHTAPGQPHAAAEGAAAEELQAGASEATNAPRQRTVTGESSASSQFLG